MDLSSTLNGFSGGIELLMYDRDRFSDGNSPPSHTSLMNAIDITSELKLVMMVRGRFSWSCDDSSGAVEGPKAPLRML